MTWLFIEPIDVWMFRDGRPFDAGSDHRAESLFPPYPTVMQGAIRTAELAHRGFDLRRLMDPAQKTAAISEIHTMVGNDRSFGNLRLRGPFLSFRDESGNITRYHPQPADATTISCEKHTLRRAGLPVPPGADVLTSSPTPYLLGLDEEPIKGETGLWLAEPDLLAYLAGKSVTGFKSGDLFERETRYGIRMDSQKGVTHQGGLYEAEFVRPHLGVGLAVEMDGYPEWNAEGFLKLGGENRPAHYISPSQIRPWPQPPPTLTRSFTVYFTTPAWFGGGWQPYGGNWSQFFSGPVKLVDAAIGRYETLGGYDLAKSEHKPSRRYVPAGSVYYFECSEPVSLKPNLLQSAITDIGSEIGFGQIILISITSQEG